MDLRNFREQIDTIDSEILRLFTERMDVCLQIGRLKKEQGLPTLDAARENEKLSGIEEKAGEEVRPYARRLFETLMELSRSYQEEKRYLDIGITIQ